MKSKLLSISLLLALSLTSCTDNEVNRENQELLYLPKIIMTETPSKETINLINMSTNFARISNELDFDNAVAATYEKYENFKLVYVPSISNDNLNAVFWFKNNKLLNLNYNISSIENKIIIQTENYQVTYFTENNIINNTLVEEYDKIDVRTDGWANNFVNCLGVVQDQVDDAICGGCGWGGLA